MIFNLHGLVKHRGRKIASGVDGRFETDDPDIIRLLQEKGFEEIKETPKAEPKAETKEKRKFPWNFTKRKKENEKADITNITPDVK